MSGGICPWTAKRADERSSNNIGEVLVKGVLIREMSDHEFIEVSYHRIPLPALTVPLHIPMQLHPEPSLNPKLPVFLPAFRQGDLRPVIGTSTLIVNRLFKCGGN